MSNHLIIRGCLKRARFALDLDLSIDLNKPPGWNLTSLAPWRSVERSGAME